MLIFPMKTRNKRKGMTYFVVLDAEKNVSISKQKPSGDEACWEYSTRDEMVFALEEAKKLGASAKSLLELVKGLSI